MNEPDWVVVLTSNRDYTTKREFHRAWQS